MAWISSMIKELAIFMLITNILSSIIPTENYKKHFKIIVGIVLIIIIIQPISKIFGNNNLVELFQEKYMVSEITELNRSMGNVNQEICNKSIESYQMELNNKIRKILGDEKINIEAVSSKITYSEEKDLMEIERIDIALDHTQKRNTIVVNKINIGQKQNSTQDLNTSYIVNLLEKYGINKEVIYIT